MEIHQEFKKCGGLDEIYDAMDTNDMSVLVKAASNALKKLNCIPTNIEARKSKTLSSRFRIKGNECYKKGLYKQALILYNKALTYAPNDSDEKTLAYGNRSAVFFAIRYFTACQEDVNNCLSMGCPKGLAKKLTKRKEATFEFVHEELVQELSTSHLFLLTYFDYFKFDCPKNADVPCTSADVTFLSQGGEKRAAAAKDIRVGTVVAMEKAFVSISQTKNTPLTCYYCLQLTPCLHPCNGCSLALFCGDECRQQCMKEYHRIECQIVDHLGVTMELLLVVRSAIKLSLKMGWDALITASYDIGSSRMRTATVRQTYNSDEPLSILSYDDNKIILEGRMFNGSIMCANVMNYLEKVPGYFPKESTKRTAAKEAMSRIMLHLFVTFTNKLLIIGSSYDFHSADYEFEVIANYGWFSMCSKLKHSCEPNLLIVGLNDSVALVALKTIKKGEELTVAYAGHSYELNSPRYETLRASNVFCVTRQICNCQRCLETKDVNSPVPVCMRAEETALLLELSEPDDENYYKLYDNACRALEIFPMYSKQHILGFQILRGITYIVQCKQTNNKTYL